MYAHPPGGAARPSAASSPSIVATAALDAIEAAARWGWCSLAERRVALPEAWPPLDDRGRARLDYWRRRAGLADPARFAARRAAEGLDEDGFGWLVGLAPPPGIGAAPASARRARATLRAALLRGEIPAAAEALTAALRDRLPFLPVLRPLLAVAADALAAAGVPAALISGRVARPHGLDDEGALGALARRLHLYAARALALDLNVARVRGALSGDDPAARFRGFVERPDAFAAAVVERPLLGRLLAEVVDHAVAAAAELWARLVDDRAALAAAGLLPLDVAPIGAVFDLSDPHGGQRSVVELAFEGGWRLMYKPRGLAVDVALADLYAALADGLSTPLVHVRTLDRGSHGWAEHVAAAPCPDDAAVARAHRRHGALLAVLHALGGADVHSENLVARGEHPIVIDAECLFVSDAPLFADGGARPLDRALLRSVFLPGLLPLYTGHGGVEVGGLGGRPGQRYDVPMPAWLERQTDRMRLGVGPAELIAAGNRVEGPGGASDVLDHVDALVEGYLEAGRLLIGRRAALVDGMAWRALAEAPTRFLVRPTSAYGTRLYDATHPDHLRSGADRDLAFEALFGGATLAGFAAAERAALWGGDVPLFRARPGGVEVVDARGARVPVTLAEPTHAELTARLMGWSEATLADDVRHIRGAFDALAVGLGRAVGGEDPAARRAARLRPEPVGEVAAEPAALVAAAEHIGDRLLGLAVRAGGEATWYGYRARADDRWSYEPASPFLYDGDAGVALFLGALAVETGGGRFAEAAEAAARYLVRRFLRADGVGVDELGAFTGWPSTAYALMHLAALLDRPALLEPAVEMLAACAPLVAHDRQLDVLGGVAGAGIVAARLAARVDDGRVAALGEAVRDRLMHAPALDGDPVLCGLSHGAAGLAWALDALRGRGDDRGRERIMALLAHERAHFDPAAGNWRDLRPQGHGAMTAWCHGAAGVGLARLELDGAGLGDAEAIAAEVEVALATTRARGRLRAQCLCHGSLGNAELLLTAAARLDRPALVDEARRWAGGALAAAAREGEAVYGLPFTRVPQPGLMTGLAGIGLGLLRIARPDRVVAPLRLG